MGRLRTGENGLVQEEGDAHCSGRLGKRADSGSTLLGTGPEYKVCLSKTHWALYSPNRLSLLPGTTWALWAAPCPPYSPSSLRGGVALVLCSEVWGKES